MSDAAYLRLTQIGGAVAFAIALTVLVVGWGLDVTLARGGPSDAWPVTTP